MTLITLKKNSSQRENQRKLPWYQPLKISSANVLQSIMSTIATMLSSYILLSILTSCQLIAVVFLAVFFSRVSPRFRVKKRQIFIALVLCLGVASYVLFDEHKDDNSANKPLSWLSGLLMVLILFSQALKSEFFAQIRDKYETSPSFVALQVSKYTFIIILIVNIVSLQFWQLCIFCWQHDRILLDLSLAAFLNALGMIFCFRTCMQYKQHVMPTIGTVRKLLSALLSSFYFKHNVNGIQYGGVGLVFGAILMDIYLNARQLRKQKIQNKEIEQDQRPKVIQSAEENQQIGEQNADMKESLLTKN